MSAICPSYRRTTVSNDRSLVAAPSGQPSPSYSPPAGTSPCPDVVTANSGTASSTTGWITGFGFTA